MRRSLTSSSQFRNAKPSGVQAHRTLRYECLEERRLLTAVVLSTSPVAGSKGVPVDSIVEATYDDAILPGSVSDQTFVVHRRQSGQLLSSLGGITSLSSVGPVVELDPAANFFPGEIVQVTATSGLLDDSSMPVAEQVWDFRTATAGGTASFIDSGQSLGSATGWHVAVGDLDLDGDLDAFVTNLKVSGQPAQDSRVWINQGGQQGGTPGQFQENGQLFSSTRHHDIALGDLDGDGDLDAFLGNSSGSANTIFVNQGGLQGGTLGQFADSGQLLGDSYTRGVALGDLDGDGDLDAFIANRQAEPNTVWINQGGDQAGVEGIFADSGQLLGLSTSYDVKLGDLDGDGDLDAYVANHGSFAVDDGEPNTVWTNDGTGTFTDSGQALGDLSSRSVTLGDIDGDGDLDAFLASSRENRVWVNQGGSQGGTAGQFVDSGQNLGASISHDAEIGDLDGDGDLDAFIVNTGASANRIWINQGGAQGGTEGQYADSGQLIGNSDTRGVALGDFDGDGDLDAFTVNRGLGEADFVWFNQNPSADFDQDEDVDGFDFLAWQRGFGTTGSATLANGDADRDSDVNGDDLAIWIEQYNASASLIAPSLESLSAQPSLTLVATDTVTHDLQEPLADQNTWLELPTSKNVDTPQNVGYLLQVSQAAPNSSAAVDYAHEDPTSEVALRRAARASLLILGENIELLAANRTADYALSDESTDSVFATWGMCQISKCVENALK